MSALLALTLAQHFFDLQASSTHRRAFNPGAPSLNRATLPSPSLLAGLHLECFVPSKTKATVLTLFREPANPPCTFAAPAKP